MFRAFLVLVTAAVVLGLVQWQYGLHLGLPHQLTGSTAVLDQPTIEIVSSPDQLAPHQTGTVSVQAQPPAAPGDPIYLQTAGTYGMGYNKVSQAVLDDNLQATLPVTARDYTGTFNYWAMIPATGTYQQGKSKTFTITFQRQSVPTDRAAPTCGGSTSLQADGEAWQCAYDDEFDGSDLDRAYWVPQTGGSTTGSGGTYACAMDSPDTVSVQNGHLSLSLVQLAAPRKCNRNKSSQYAFGQVMHYQTFSQTYGKYEIRAKLPSITDPGVQESFWLWPVKNTYGSWPASGEMDFAEIYSSQANLDRPYLHYLPGATTAGTNDNVTHNNCPINPGVYNTYGFEWKPGQLTVLVNDQVCFIDDYSSAAASAQGANSPFDKPFYLSMNQAMGTLNNALTPGTVSLPATTEVDYVRVWSLVGSEGAKAAKKH